MRNRNQSQRKRRRDRVRAKLYGTKARPRLTVFRSNKYTYAQIIDDEKRITLVAASEMDVKDAKRPKAAGAKTAKKTTTELTKMEKAKHIGQALAIKAAKKGIKEVVFDRGAYKFHGRVKMLAEGARSEGLKF